jgi:hypothetical protein
MGRNSINSSVFRLLAPSLGPASLQLEASDLVSHTSPPWGTFWFLTEEQVLAAAVGYCNETQANLVQNLQDAARRPNVPPDLETLRQKLKLGLRRIVGEGSSSVTVAGITYDYNFGTAAPPKKHAAIDQKYASACAALGLALGKVCCCSSIWAYLSSAAAVNTLVHADLADALCCRKTSRALTATPLRALW